MSAYFFANSLLFACSIIAILLLLGLFFYIYTLHKKLQHFFAGKNSLSLEATIRELQERVNELDTALGMQHKALQKAEKKISSAVRNTELLRYKAFEGNASNQSFSLSLVDEKGDGAVLSSLHIRDRISVYAKNIHGWSSDVELTEEEKEVLQRSKEGQRKE